MDSGEDFETRILRALDKQNETMERIAKAIVTMEKHSNIDHDDRPFPLHDLRTHEPAWRAMFETLIAKMNDQVERWRNGMDSTLIFVALFVTVITTFQSPVSQNLSPNPVDLTNDILANLTTIIYEVAVLNGLKVPTTLPQPQPFVPAISDQVVTLLWYSSLLLSLITAVLSVVGRQWVEHLTQKPEEGSYQVKSLRLGFREILAQKYLRPLLDCLHPILVLSMIIFVIGLLYQLWTISLSSDHKAPILVLTSSVGNALALGTAIGLTVTFVHGVYVSESPFTTSTALAVRRWIPECDIRTVETRFRWRELFKFLVSTITQVVETDHFNHISSIRLFENHRHSPSLEDVEHATNAIVHVLGSDASIKAKQTVARSLFEWDGSSNLEQSENHLERLHDCHFALTNALNLAYVDTPSNQKTIRRSFFVAKIAAHLLFNYDDCDLAVENHLEDSFIRDLFLRIFTLPYDEMGYVHNAKMSATLDLENFLKTEVDSQFFDGLVDEYSDFLDTIVVRDGADRWKSLILPYLTQENITELLDLISVTAQESTEAETRFYLNRMLCFVLRFYEGPLDFPEGFNISWVFVFLLQNESDIADMEQMYHDLIFDDRDPLPPCVDVVLSYLAIMDGKTLARQEGLPEFLFRLVHQFELGPERPSVRRGMPPVDIATLLGSVTAIPDDDEELDSTGSDDSSSVLSSLSEELHAPYPPDYDTL